MLSAVAIVVVLSTPQPVDLWPVSKRVVSELARIGFKSKEATVKTAKAVLRGGDRRAALIILDSLEDPIPGNLYKWHRRDGSAHSLVELLENLQFRIKKPLPAKVERALYRQDAQSIYAAYAFIKAQQRAGSDAGLGTEVVEMSRGRSPIDVFCWLLARTGATKASLEIERREESWLAMDAILNTSDTRTGRETRLELGRVIVREPDRLSLSDSVYIANKINVPETTRAVAQRLIREQSEFRGHGEQNSLDDRVPDIALSLVRDGEEKLANRLINAYWEGFERRNMSLNPALLEWLAESGQKVSLLNLARAAERYGQYQEGSEYSWMRKGAIELYFLAGRSEEALGLVESLTNDTPAVVDELKTEYRTLLAREEGLPALLRFTIANRPEMIEEVTLELVEDALEQGQAGEARRMLEFGAKEMARQKVKLRATVYDSYIVELPERLRQFDLEPVWRELVFASYTEDPSDLRPRDAAKFGALYASLGEDEIALPYILRGLESKRPIFGGLSNLVREKWGYYTDRSLADLFSLAGTDVVERGMERLLAPERPGYESLRAVVQTGLAVLEAVQEDGARSEQLLGYVKRALEKVEPDRAIELERRTLKLAIDALAVEREPSKRELHPLSSTQDKVLDILLAAREARER